MEKKSKKIACIFNYAPHYRKLIYNIMAKELGCDFYFGANLPGGQKIKKMDLAFLPGFKKESKVFRLRYMWQCNVVRQVFKNYQIYILTGHAIFSNIIFMFFAKLLKKKVFLWTHGFKKVEEGKRFYVRFFFKNATGYFLYGNYGKQMMIEYGIPEDRLHVINNSLGYDRQLEVRTKLTSSKIYVERFNNNDPVIIFSGRLISDKKLDYLLESQKQLLNENPFNLVLVGDGPETTRLKQIADELGLTDRVWFYGACYDEEVIGDLFYNATLTVSPGNVGLTVIHSMMYGTPVLAHNNTENQGPEYEAVIQGKTGLLFEEDDVKDMSSNIKKWITEFTDRETVRKKCFSIIDDYYNPYYSIDVMKRAINAL